VGALSPDIDSVTKAFYDAGWSGINIEPNPHEEAAFSAERPRDVNLTVAVAEQPGRLTLNVFPGTGLSTLDEAIARDHVRSGLEARRHEVEVLTLTQIFTRYVPQVRRCTS
jgi:hypothetical protein